MDNSDFDSFKTLVIVCSDFDNLPNLNILNNLNKRKILKIRKSKGKSNGRQNGKIANKSIKPNAEVPNLILFDRDVPLSKSKSAVQNLKIYSTEKTKTENSSKFSKYNS